MTRVKLLALDLDGTLYNTEKIVSDENKKALAAAKEKGVKVVITTGRPLKAIGNLLEELDLLGEENYSITFNGGLVQRNTGHILDKSALSLAEVYDIHQQLAAVGLPTDVISDGTVYSLSGNDGRRSQYHLASPLLNFVSLQSFAELPKDITYNKIVTVTDPKVLDQQLARLPKTIFEDFEAFKSRDIIFEIMPKGIHKAFGLDLLCQHLGLEAKHVMAMGDEANDFSMLQWAGLGVAMANAVDQAKEVADAVTTLTNDQSGVAEAIWKYILNEEG
ncbi:haloacid dehalogenase [Streptococcus equi subsp. zooepidemicus]|uniref:Cof-type HAD-IIB family hydrolase n=1 Tax=Streptococcus equi TaxID=1336 RepID=UPI000DA338A3|nr:Cof-type HAD-IIB family hydrolase [Streptococcus equi]SQF05980.1 haloacid dehalogenase [Streptococcus equi subsp. zooepidemicus]HEL0619540.1 HAD family phosphatase [Streptococcus equi subsp. zooepidemicus]HEL0625295.1 HAD family phosphatase [Streptococcus equi subsp. zooepidemicus]HEL0735607.1 HAD family phosphatase [Streptococcus equi subsp. zooepidemicus]HEL1255769.1 HAD family phosphatase [Streptococcus equi subsp. zooepidemicus]